MNAPAEASGTGSGSTTAATLAAEEIKKLKGQFYTLVHNLHEISHMELSVEVPLLQKENSNAAHPPAQHTEITSIPKPRGEAGSKGFKLIREMGLDDTEEHKKLYHTIMVRGKKQVKYHIVTATFVIPFHSRVSVTVSSNALLTSPLTFVELTPMIWVLYSSG